jgi:uncharacterized protein YneF (UPF0154 family)
MTVIIVGAGCFLAGGILGPWLYRKVIKKKG